MTKRRSEKRGEKSITGVNVVLDTKATGRKIRELIEKSPYTIEDIAELAMCSPQAVYKWLRGDAMPCFENMFTLKAVLGTDPENLLVRRVEITHRDGRREVSENR